MPRKTASNIMNTRRGNSATHRTSLPNLCWLRGIKTGTASAEELYKIDNEPIPTEGEYSVILNSRDEAVCVIRTTKVYIVPFCDVSAHHAFCEGEGDRSLAYWRKVHEEFFRDEYAACGLEFSQDIPVVCEEFELLMKAEEC